MTGASNHQAQLREIAASAMQRGDGKAALAALARIPDAPPLTWAQAHIMASDFDAAEAIADKILHADPRNIWGLIFKGDCMQHRGDTRAATDFYKTARDFMQQSGQVSPALQRATAYVDDKLAKLSVQFEDDLRTRMAAAGFGGNNATPRVAEALDILTGRRQIQLQQPRSFYFPGLPQIQFYEREQFEWVAELEAQTSAIREELIAVLAGSDDFTPYVENSPDRPINESAMVGDARWSAYHFWKDGDLLEANAARCPATMTALAGVPSPHINGWSPLALFSLLRPGMHIPPHRGFLNTRLICHLPLVTPPGCLLRVGNEEREWEQGKMLIFDDSIVHEARNTSRETRVVLLFDIWRPEIDEADRAALTVLFEFIASYAR